MLVYILSLLLAANGLLVELNLSQVLSAALGGTILRYHTSIGLFTFSLGLGALLYPLVKQKIKDRNLLLASSLLVGGIGVLGPIFIYQIDPLGSPEYLFSLTIITYIPIIVLGVVTGVEIPALFNLMSSEVRESSLNRSQLLVLCFDYFGMVLVSIFYPILLMKLGVFKINFIVSFLTILSLLILFFIKEESKLLKKGEKTFDKYSLKQKSILLVIFITSFCSISYELLLAKIFSDILSNEIIAHSVTIGFYLLGLGLGVFSTEKKIGNFFKDLIKVEYILVLSALSMTAFIYGFFSLWKVLGSHYFNGFSVFLLLQIVTIWLGYWSGKELPLSIGLLKNRGQHFLPLAINYFGALFAGFVVPLVFLPRIGISGGVFVVGFLNLFVLVILLLMAKRLKKAVSVWLVICLCFMFTKNHKVNHYVEQLFLKTHYYKIYLSELSVESLANYLRLIESYKDVTRLRTPYQFIDVSREQYGSVVEELDDITLYLNLQPQFSLKTWRLYHDSFSFGALNLSQNNPENVLILGGGDGLLASLLSEIKTIDTITMIELDKDMVEFSKKHREISAAGKDIFKKNIIKIIHDDAYSWLKKNEKRYDAIFIDFPYPTSFELSRLYSVEFYKLVNNSLEDKGFMIVDAPVSFMIDGSGSGSDFKSKVLLKTLRSSGFKGVFPFGPIEPFIYAEKNQRKFKFQYESLDFLKNRSFVNLSTISMWFSEGDLSDEYINSIYHPILLDMELQ